MRIGLIGAGMVGSTLARLWAHAGHEVLVSSRHPEALAELVERLGHGARAGTPADAARHGEVVVLSVPFGATPLVADGIRDLVAGKIVVDTGNPFPRRDGRAADDALRHHAGSLGYVADQLPDARLVKAFNTVFQPFLRDGRTRQGDPVAIPLVGEARARVVVADLIRDAGMVPVQVGEVDACPRIDPGSKVWNRAWCEQSLREALDLA